MVSVVAQSRKNFKSYRDNSDDDDYSSEESEVEYLAPLGSDETSEDDLEGAEKRVEQRVLIDKSNLMETKPNRRDAMKKMAARRRRRSSSRFLSQSKRFEADETEEDDEEVANTTAANIRNNKELGEMYRQAIRMNTENRINAGNSWNLNLIENIDKFLCDEDVEDDQQIPDDASKHRSKKKDSFLNLQSNTDQSNKKRVNFTKASCTLDASVKIYSYRVDDVHLTSYKVLANLNRTGNKDDDEYGEKPSKAGQRKQSERRNMDSTIESNVANLNISKMDSALDIDPLFHKMSKSFDEGGAKGLLLVNLGVAADSCRVVFDSNEPPMRKKSNENESKKIPSTPLLTTISEQDENEDEMDDESMEDPETPKNMDDRDMDIEGQDDKNNDSPEEKDEFANVEPELSALEPPLSLDENTLDISMLSSKFESLLGGTSFASVPFMPQMKSVREDFHRLDAEGFVTTDEPSVKSKRYAISAKEEREAEETIHREALERTRMSAVNNSFAASVATEQTGFEGDDFGDDDFGGDMTSNFDDGFNSTMMNETMDIQPSFYNDNNITFNDELGFVSSGNSGGIAPFNERKTTVRLLDIICNTDSIGSGGRYEYFDSSALEKMTGGNSWAGSAHWKKGGTLFRKKNKQRQSEDGLESKKNSSRTKRTFFDLMNSEVLESDIASLMKPAIAKRGVTDPLQLSKASITKNKKEDNVLPHDAEISADKLFRLFLRPNSTVVVDKTSEGSENGKRVGFLDQNVDFDDDYGLDDGPAFNILDGKGDINENDDFVVANLDGVRKVDKVEVGYATVAKKVDVKRLKQDLWTELEMRTSSQRNEESDGEEEEKHPNEDEDKQMNEDCVEDEVAENQDEGISFQEVVNCLDGSQRQEDVSVAFYFICLLHLANEKCLKLDSEGQDLKDFLISRDQDGLSPLDKLSKMEGLPVSLNVREKRETKVMSYTPESDDDDNDSEEETNETEYSEE